MYKTPKVSHTHTHNVRTNSAKGTEKKIRKLVAFIYIQPEHKASNSIYNTIK